MAEGHSPLSQFEVKTLIPLPSVGGYNIDFTNSSMFMVLAVIGVYVFLYAGMSGRALVPGRWQSMVEMTYEFIAGMVRENVGTQGKAYFPFIFTLFMFVLFCNLLGMIPYSFTATSHIIVTFALAMMVFLGVTLIGFAKHGIKFLKLFCPEGVPVFMAPIIIPIELLSYLSRPISLSMRLAVNMMAGHTLLKVIAMFVMMMGVAGVVPLVVLVGLTGFEVFVALLQAYVFTVLTCVYLNDSIHLH